MTDSLADRLGALGAHRADQSESRRVVVVPEELRDEVVEALREKDAEIRRLRKAIWPSGQIGRHR